MRDILSFEDMLKVLLDVYKDCYWPRADSPSLRQGKNLVQCRCNEDSHFSLESLTTKRGWILLATLWYVIFVYVLALWGFDCISRTYVWGSFSNILDLFLPFMITRKRELSEYLFILCYKKLIHYNNIYVLYISHIKFSQPA